MITLPLDQALTPVKLSEPRLQIKNKETGEIAIDRETGQKLYQLDVAVTFEGQRPMTFALSVPEAGLSEDVGLYSPFRAVGLTFSTGEMNGRTWQKFRATSITPLNTPATSAKEA